MCGQAAQRCSAWSTDHRRASAGAAWRRAGQEECHLAEQRLRLVRRTRRLAGHLCGTCETNVPRGGTNVRTSGTTVSPGGTNVRTRETNLSPGGTNVRRWMPPLPRCDERVGACVVFSPAHAELPPGGRKPRGATDERLAFARLLSSRRYLRRRSLTGGPSSVPCARDAHVALEYLEAAPGEAPHPLPAACSPPGKGARRGNDPNAGFSLAAQPWPAKAVCPRALPVVDAAVPGRWPLCRLARSRCGARSRARPRT